MSSALDKQVGGNHYKKYKIQPMQFAMDNGLNALEFSVLKYVTRYLDKNGIEDLKKAKHCLEMLTDLPIENRINLAIPMTDYCKQNQLTIEQTGILTELSCGMYVAAIDSLTYFIQHLEREVG